MNTSNNNLKDFLKDCLSGVIGWLMDHLKIVLPVILAICVLITVLISVGAHNRKAAAEAETEQAQEEQSTVQVEPLEVPQVELKLNDSEEITKLFETYYSATVDGDIETIKSLNNSVLETEEIAIKENSKYLESYQDMEIYTKAGPIEGSYVAFVSLSMKFFDFETPVPGLQAYYVCTDENGKLYLNEAEDDESVINYISEVTLQDDVVDLNNKAAAKYNDMVAEDADLVAFLVDVTTQIDTAVGEELAKAEAGEPEEEEGEEETEESAAPAVTVTKVRATDVVNVRSSDSETADKLGKAQIGQEFTLLEERGNGWSKIDYDGKEAFIKSDYLEPAATEIVVEEAGTDDTATDISTADDGNTTVSGTVKVKENVRIRAAASETSEKLGTVYVGQELELIQKQADGWSKIKYNGKTAYVKSEFVE